MAHFIGYLQGNRGDVSRLGSKSSGITASAQGWRIGVDVIVMYDEEKKKDKVIVRKTSGSNREKESEVIAEYYEE